MSRIREPFRSPAPGSGVVPACCAPSSPERGISNPVRDNRDFEVRGYAPAVPAETHVEQSPMSRQQVFELIRDRLADILEIDAGEIAESSSFSEDLDADSLALIELVEALEEELSERSVGFRIDDEDLEDLKTVRDAVDYVVAKLEQG